MSKSLVLITGVSGMVGYAVLGAALRAGYRIRVAVPRPEDLEDIKKLASAKGYCNEVEPVVVNDVTVPGAYDTAVQDVDYIIHAVSPLADTKFQDYEKELIQPAIKETLGLLESANRTSCVKRVVQNSLAASVIPKETIMAGEDNTVYDEKSAPQTDVPGPFDNIFEAYLATKVAALKLTYDFVKEKKPSFDVISIGTGIVIGRDNTITEASKIMKGSNFFAISQLLGEAAPPAVSLLTHLDDVALLHVKALDPAIKGNQYFIATANGPDGPTWADAYGIVKKRYPKEVADGIFKFDTPTSTIHVKTDSSFTEKTFGITLKGYEEALISLLDHYLELSEKKE